MVFTQKHTLAGSGLVNFFDLSVQSLFQGGTYSNLL